MSMPTATEPETELWDLENLARARRLGDWMFEQFADLATGHVVEVGAGIGTFSRRLLDAGAQRALLIEPEPACADRLEADLGGDPRVTISRDTVPGSAALDAVAGEADLVLSQNVLEHIPDDAGAVAQMAGALRPGGALVALVPAHPRLYGELDRRYGHERRYTRERLRSIVEAAGCTVEDLYSFNMLGVLGWVVNRRRADARIDPRSLRAYELLLPPWRALERRRRPPFGLSLVVRARKAG
jgi:SAM-dependent methyltransferase